MSARAQRRTLASIAATAMIAVGCAPGNRADVGAPAAASDPQPSGPLVVVSCAGVESKHGASVCVDELTPEQASHRSLVFVVSQRDGHTVRVERKTGAGEPAEAITGMFSMDFRYQRGVVVERTARRVDGAVAMTILLEDSARRRVWLDAAGRPLLRAGAEGHVAVYEIGADGWDVVERMMTGDGRPRRDTTGVFVWRYERDTTGHVTAESAFDAAGRPMLTTDGWHVHRRGWSALGCESAERYFGVDGAPVAVSRGVADYRYTCDRWGNRESVRYFDAAGRPVSVDDGEWGLQWARDEHGKVLTRTALDEQGQPRRPTAK